MTAPERIWADLNGTWYDEATSFRGVPYPGYILATPEAIASSPEVAALIAEARRDERERMLCVLGEEYILKHASEGPDERLGRASAVRGVAVRMGLYADLDRAIDAAIRALKETTHD